MSQTRRHIRVFFSWQNDLSQGPTTRAIRAALRAAATELEAEQPVDFTMEEATSNEPGAPYVPYALAEKIRVADVYVSDITTVVRIGDAGKSHPNANVTFELGIASAHLGWARIVMLFNKAFAELVDLPFDFDRQRISTFQLAEGAEKAVGPLRKLLKEALATIIKHDPKRPREMEGLDPEKIRRERDVSNIQFFMRQLSTVVLDRLIEELPTYIRMPSGFIYDGVLEALNRSDFALYDQDVYVEMAGLRDALGEALGFDQFYRETASGNTQVFGRHGEYISAEDERKALKAISDARNRLHKHLSALLSLIRERYLEVDIDETNSRFAASYRRFTGADTD